MDRFLFKACVKDVDVVHVSGQVARDLPEGFPTLKAVNPTRLPSDLEPAALVAGAVMVLVRLLGGRRDWEEGFDALVRYCRQQGVPLLAWSGEQHVDAELTAEVRRAIASLPPLQREALVLFEYEDLSLAEIAAVVGADSNAVKARLFRARDKLRASLGRYFRIGRETATVKRA